MILKKEYIFLIVNYIIFIVCWGIFKSEIILKSNNLLEIIGLINLLIHTVLIFGGEGIIYCIFSTKKDLKVVLRILLISMTINICMSIISNGSAIIIYLSINQIIGVIIGRVISFFRNKKYL